MKSTHYFNEFASQKHPEIRREQIEYVLAHLVKREVVKREGVTVQPPFHQAISPGGNHGDSSTRGFERGLARFYGATGFDNLAARESSLENVSSNKNYRW
jgi:hypothetical protein